MPSMRMAAIALAVSGLVVSSPGDRSLAAEPAAPVEVRVMYWNLYLGAPLEPVIGAALQAPETLPAAVALAWAQVQATDFPARAKLLVDQIEASDPDIAGLGEGALWRLQDPGDSLSERPKPAKTVVYDFLKVLRKELKSRKLPYRLVVVETGTDIEMPGMVDGGLVDVRYTDRDAVLVKKGTKASKKRSGVFETKLELGFTDSLRTWTSVDARKGAARFRFVATHLEDGVEPVQQGQAAELLAGPALSDLPVVLTGDFNSDPDRDYSPAVHAQILAGGFTDAWTTVNPADPGLTWGHAADLSNTGNEFTLRLDHVYLSEGVTAVHAWLVGEDPADRSGGLWPSDHAGLVVNLSIP
jgi:hypothetical protein